MGLDMWLHRRRFVKNFDHTPPEKRWEVIVKQGGEEVSKNVFDPAKAYEVTEEMAYWRKANAIHDWFIQNCADGEDNCQDVWVTREQLETLLETVDKVLKASKLVKGKIENGYSYEKDPATGKLVKKPNLVDGEYIEDPTVAKKLLPTAEGFFFGSTDYDQWYVEDLKYTKKVLTEALMADERSEFYYRASW